MSAAINERINSIQHALQKEGLDGWLLFDYENTNPYCKKVIGSEFSDLSHRRFFFLIPAKGNPQRIVSKTEEGCYTDVPGSKRVYMSYTELKKELCDMLKNYKKVAMEYSPEALLPSVSKVDGGTLELVKGCGVEIASSAELLQDFNTPLTLENLKSHCAAEKVLLDAFDLGFNAVRAALLQGNTITELDVAQMIEAFFEENDCETCGTPIVSTQANAADPHYVPTANRNSPIVRGDFLLLDLWCKKRGDQNLYADYAQVAVVDAKPQEIHQKIFDIVRESQQKGVAYVIDCCKAGRDLAACEIDRACRDVVEKAGYGRCFYHNTGHSIGTYNVHGAGPNIDSFEVYDSRILRPGSCFSIEPGIYLEGRFGVRLEVDVFLKPDGTPLITGLQQESIRCILY